MKNLRASGRRAWFCEGRGFSLIEILIVAAILGILVALGIPVVRLGLSGAARAKSVAQLRQIGLAMSLYSGEHDGRFVGPLWPGQVMEFDPARSGRLVGELAAYLAIQTNSVHVVEGMIPQALRGSLPGVAVKDIRVYVMNMAVPVDGGTTNVWGSLAASPPTAPLLRSVLEKKLTRTWAMSEAYQTHPAVVSAPWKMCTGPQPLFGRLPLALFFDGGVGFCDPAAVP